MKKLTTLLVMLLFTAGMAIGQNNATVQQSDDGNEAFIDQFGEKAMELFNGGKPTESSSETQD